MNRYKINTHYLANILYNIGDYLYKSINGVHYSFDVRKNNHILEVIIINDEVGGELVMMTIDTTDDNRINYVVQYINNRFDFPKMNIIVENWEKYMIGGINEI